MLAFLKFVQNCLVCIMITEHSEKVCLSIFGFIKFIWRHFFLLETYLPRKYEDAKKKWLKSNGAIFKRDKMLRRVGKEFLILFAAIRDLYLLLVTFAQRCFMYYLVVSNVVVHTKYIFAELQAANITAVIIMSYYLWHVKIIICFVEVHVTLNTATQRSHEL